VSSKSIAAASISAIALLAMAGTAQAEEAEDQSTILVIGKAEGYVAKETVTATKTDTPLIDVPQTVNVITREQIEDQAQHSIADVLRYVPGVTIGQGEGNRDQITLRGQNTTADFFLDGVRDDVQYYRNLYNIERVEVLKGPYALIFGRGGGGGIVNRVQKAPSAERFFATASGSVNTFGAWDVAADVNAPIGAGGALRVNAFYENLDNHRDFFGGERYAFNPYLAFELGAGWQAGLSYEYVKDDRVTDRGVPALACTQPCTPMPLTGHDSTFFGVPGVNRTGVEAHIVKGRLDGQLTESLNWSTTLLYGNYDKFYTNVYANGAATGPNGTVALSGYTDPTQRENFIAQTNLVWDVAVGGTEHKVLMGLEYSDQDSVNRRFNAVLSNGTLDLSNIVYPTVTFPAITRHTRSNVKVFSAYAQDQIAFGDHIDVILGLRYDRFHIEGVDIANSNPFDRIDEKISPRFGLIIKPQENVSIYGSYSQSFLPRSGDQFLRLGTNDANLAPERFTNYEVGAKWDIRPDLSATLALFQLDRTNATEDNNQGGLNNAGETRTRGLELSLVGQLTPNWQVSGGYTYQDAKLKTSSARLGQVPEHQFAVWNRYDVSPQFGVGLGVIHQSSQFAANNTSPTTTLLPAFTRVDAAVFFKPTENIDLQVNVENLFDTDYFSDAHNNNNISPGAPINARFTARVRF
jgi:catecholate siderophore receptor